MSAIYTRFISKYNDRGYARGQNYAIEVFWYIKFSEVHLIWFMNFSIEGCVPFTKTFDN